MKRSLSLDLPSFLLGALAVAAMSFQDEAAPPAAGAEVIECETLRARSVEILDRAGDVVARLGPSVEGAALVLGHEKTGARASLMATKLEGTPEARLWLSSPSPSGEGGAAHLRSASGHNSLFLRDSDGQEVGVNQWQGVRPIVPLSHRSPEGERTDWPGGS